MRQQTFNYRGRDLREPLSKLRETLTKQIGLLEFKIKSFDSTPIKNSITMNPIDSPAAKLTRMKAELSGLRDNLLVADNWFREAVRTPWRKWTLDFADLYWLYPQESSFETKGS